MPESIILQELRLMKFRDYDDHRCAGRLTQSEAASLLGMSERPFRCYSRHYEAEGERVFLIVVLGVFRRTAFVLIRL